MATYAAALLSLCIVGVVYGQSRFPLTGNSGSGSRLGPSDNFGNSGSGNRFGSSGSSSDNFGNSGSGNRFGSSGSSSDNFGNSGSGSRLGPSSDSFGFGSNNRGSSANSDFGDSFDSDDGGVKTGLVRARIQLWPDATIPYEIAPEISDGNSNGLRRMLSAIAAKTCVTFVPHRSESNYTLFKDGKGCSAPLGMSFRPQKVISSSSSGRLTSNSNSRFVSGASLVTLAPGCFTTIRVARRIMNLLGLPHETSRPDRDQFVDINMNNIKPTYVSNLEQYTASSYPDGVLSIPYDYQSVTQYTDDDLAKNPGTWAIRPKNSRMTARDLGGDNFSQKDFDKINAAYKCRNSGSFGSNSRGISSQFGGGRASGSNSRV